MKVLVVGASGFVGRRILKFLQSQGIPAVGSTRQRFAQYPFFSFDLDKDDIETALTDITHAIVTASITNYKECEVNPHAPIINAVLIPQLIFKLLSRGVKTNYISSNTVFGGNIPWPNEDTATCGTLSFQYALQKKTAEDVILKLANENSLESNLQITRLTKVLDATTKPFDSWYKSFTERAIVEPFEDLIFSPITVDFAARHIVEIVLNFPGGIYHLSGKENTSYVDFCYSLAEVFHFDKNLIRSTTSTKKNIEIPFLPKFSGLGMHKTSTITRFMPQEICELVNYLKEQFHGV